MDRLRKLAFITASALSNIAVAAVGGGSIVGAGDEPISQICTEQKAEQRGLQVAMLIAELNGYPREPFAVRTALPQDQGNYYVEVFFDTGLTVPVHTILIHSYSCAIESVEFRDEEG